MSGGAIRQNWLMVAGGFEVRVACGEDTNFVREMARHAATLEDRPLPAPDGIDVTDLLPGPGDVTVVAVAAGGEQLGAAWWRTAGRDPLVPAVPDAPQVVMAVAPEARGRHVGTALLESLLGHAPAHGHSTVVLNVHLRNTPALHLYMKCGFRVAGAGRGWFGVTLARPVG